MPIRFVPNPRFARVQTSEPFAANVALRTIGARFLIGQRVRHVTQDDEEKPGIVTGVHINDCAIRYYVAFQPGGDCPFLECELTDDDDQATGVS